MKKLLSIIALLVLMAAASYYFLRTADHEVSAPVTVQNTDGIVNDPGLVSQATDHTSTSSSQVVTADIEFGDLSSGVIGQKFLIMIPQENRSVSAEITSRTTSDAGNTTLFSRHYEGEKSYPVIVTVGRLQTFGTVQTSRDRYQFEIREGTGQIVSVSSIARIQDFSEKDYVIPRDKVEE